MKSEFTAKDIQEMLGIPKHRYEYVASKIGIEPDEPGEGRGHSHIYSFKNALEFAFAHHASVRGLSPEACRNMLRGFRAYDQPETPIYEDRIKIDFWFYFVRIKGSDYFAVSGTYHNSQNMFLDVYGRKYWKGTLARIEKTISELGGAKKIKNAREKWLSSAETYTVINLGTIKKRVMEYSAR